MADAPAGGGSDFARIKRRADRIWAAADQYRNAPDQIHEHLTPPDERFFALEPGPMVRNEADRKPLAVQLDDITRIVDATFSTGTFHTASHEMYADLFSGQGAMLSNPSDGDDIVQDVAVPGAEIAREADPCNRIAGRVRGKD